MENLKDNYRLIFGIIFAVSVFMLVEAWIREHSPRPASPAPASSAQGAPQTGANSVPVPTGPSAAPAASAASPSAAEVAKGQRIAVVTDLMRVEIDTAGGDLRRVELLKHRDPVDRSRNFILMHDAGTGRYVTQTGLLGSGQPNHTTVFSAAQSEYQLAGGKDELIVALKATSADGGVHDKIYKFRRGSYLVDVSLRSTLAQGAAPAGHAYFQLIRDDSAPPGSSMMMPTYTGGGVYTELTKLVQLTFDKVTEGKLELPKDAKDGWIAVIQHYFLGAWLPQAGVPREYFARKVQEGLFAFGVIVPLQHAGNVTSVTMPLYIGPQEQEALKKLAPGLEYTVDYGWLRMLAEPIFWVLEKIHDYVHNWGVAIIILTIMIKLIFYPLSAASYRSMGKMKVLAPKLQRLKERYGDDRQKLHQAMMDMYKTEKVNPLGGCLPILVQIPVFIALYWVLLQSVELRQAPFMLWIDDLSAKDPFYVLPVLMGITMFLQTMLNPTPPDPMQAKLMKIMPVAFSIFFFFFPAGLVLYWLVNNILSIAQQWHITRAIEREKTAHDKV